MLHDGHLFNEALFRPTCHAIPVRVDLPGVGSRLYDHPNVPMQFDITNEKLSMARYQRIVRAIWLGLQYLSNHSGPGGGSLGSVILFHALRHLFYAGTRGFFTPMVFRGKRTARGWNLQTLLHPGRSVVPRGERAYPGFQFDINLLRPKSCGTVRLVSKNRCINR